MAIQNRKIEAKESPSMRFDPERGEIRLFGTRIALTNLLPTCKRMDEVFGTGGEVIIHSMAFEQGRRLFEEMMRNDPNENKEELLEKVVDLEAQAGWGITRLEIISNNTPEVEVTVKNSPVKTSQGSSKRLIGSFWVGVLSRYFERQLKCVSFSYDEKEDKFRCTITA